MATNTEIKINLTTIIVIVAIILLVIGGGWYLYHNKVNKLKDDIDVEVKLKNALIDKEKIYQNNEKEWVTEKLTLQESIKNLKKINNNLTESEKELIKRVKEADKENSIITAALIQSNVIIDSLMHHGTTTVDTTKKYITFTDSIKNKKGAIILTYDIVVNKVLPAIPNVKPILMFQKLTLPNVQFVEFHWKDSKKANYPIAFSVTNSNDYFRTVNIDSYAIPELQKPIVDPNGWQKIGQFFTKNGNRLLIFGIGGLSGATAYHFLSK